MCSFLIFPLNDILLNEILKNPKTTENQNNKVKIKPTLFFGNETIEI